MVDNTNLCPSHEKNYKELAKELVEKYHINYVFDDRNQVVKMWREAGFRCLQVADGNF